MIEHPDRTKEPRRHPAIRAIFVVFGVHALAMLTQLVFVISTPSWPPSPIVGYFPFRWIDTASGTILMPYMIFRWMFPHTLYLVPIVEMLIVYALICLAEIVAIPISKIPFVERLLSGVGPKIRDIWSKFWPWFAGAFVNSLVMMFFPLSHYPLQALMEGYESSMLVFSVLGVLVSSIGIRWLVKLRANTWLLAIPVFALILWGVLAIFSFIHLLLNLFVL